MVKKNNLLGFAAQDIGHLGLVAGMCKELDIAGIIDREAGTQAHNKKISFGKAVVCMILNGLGFVSRTLYMYSEYFDEKPLNHLLGTKDLRPEQIDDNLLGRALDKLFDLNVTNLFTKIALKAVKTLGIKVKSLHLDSTSFHVDGEYRSSLEQGESCIKLVPGYSRDHRPDLNQAVLNLMASNQGNLPLYMQAASGNSTDKTVFPEIIKKHIASFQAVVKNKHFVGDSALYTPSSLCLLQQNKALFVTRVPAVHKKVKEIIFSTNKDELVEIGEGYFAKEVKSNYGDVEQRWVIIFSQAAHEKECRTFKKTVKKGTQKEQKEIWHLQNQEFSCKNDAKKALNKCKVKLKYIAVNEFQIVEHKKHKAPGRPKKEAQAKGSVYKISCQTTADLQKIAEQESRKGYFILSTNDLNYEKFPPQEVLQTYKAQQSVERGFRFLKSPDFLVSSFYLKKPERIEALLMVMTLCLLVYAAIEYKTRCQLKTLNLYFLDQKKRPYQNPTTRWIFFCFLSLHMLMFEGDNIRVGNLKERHRIILSSLGPPYEYFYYAERW